MVALYFARDNRGSWSTFRTGYCCIRGCEKPAAAPMAVKETDDDTSSMVDSVIQGGTQSMKSSKSL